MSSVICTSRKGRSARASYLPTLHPLTLPASSRPPPFDLNAALGRSTRSSASTVSLLLPYLRDLPPGSLRQLPALFLRFPNRLLTLKPLLYGRFYLPISHHHSGYANPNLSSSMFPWFCYDSIEPLVN